MTPEREAQMRELFEADRKVGLQRCADGTYMSMFAQAEWESWLACARALEPMVRDAQEHERRLLWVSENWVASTGNKYESHVMNRGGTGDLSDICTFIDKHFPRKNTLSAALEERNATE